MIHLEAEVFPVRCTRQLEWLDVQLLSQRVEYVGERAVEDRSRKLSHLPRGPDVGQRQTNDAHEQLFLDLLRLVELLLGRREGRECFIDDGKRNRDYDPL